MKNSAYAHVADLITHISIGKSVTNLNGDSQNGDDYSRNGDCQNG